MKAVALKSVPRLRNECNAAYAVAVHAPEVHRALTQKLRQSATTVMHRHRKFKIGARAIAATPSAAITIQFYISSLELSIKRAMHKVLLSLGRTQTAQAERERGYEKDLKIAKRIKMSASVRAVQNAYAHVALLLRSSSYAFCLRARVCVCVCAQYAQ